MHGMWLLLIFVSKASVLVTDSVIVLCSAEPPVDEFEIDQMDHWYCKICLSKKSSTLGNKGNKGPFKILIQDMEKKNPLAFALPADIKNYFADISATSEGDYTDFRYSKSTKRYFFVILFF